MPYDSSTTPSATSYDRLEHRGIYQRQVAEREEEFVINSLRRASCKTILEVGSGTGRFTRHLQHLAPRVVATDVDSAMIAKTRKRVGDSHAVEYRVATMETLPDVPGYGRFDCALAMRVIPHCEQWQEALGILHRAVRPGGLILFDLWNRRSFIGWLLRRQQYDDLALVHRLEPEEIQAAVGELPGEVVDTLRWGFPRLGPLQADSLFALLMPQRAYSTTFCLQVK